MNSTLTTPRNVVCGVDGSEHASTVISTAASLADRLGLPLRVVHSAHPDVFLVGDERRSALERGDALLDTLVPEAAGAERVVQLGDPAQLLGAVGDEGAALAVVGSRGRGPVRAALLGSVSHALLGFAPCPVVVVGPHSAARGAAPTSLVCGVDGSDGAVMALRSAGTLASVLDAELLVVHVRSNALERLSLDIVDRGLAQLEADVPVRIRVEIGEPAARLAAVAGQERSSMLVVGSRGLGPMRAALLGSVSQRLSATAPTPVMIVPPTGHGAGLATLTEARPVRGCEAAAA